MTYRLYQCEMLLRFHSCKLKIMHIWREYHTCSITTAKWLQKFVSQFTRSNQHTLTTQCDACLIMQGHAQREHTTLASNLTATASGHVFICSNASSLFVRVPPITNECPLPPPFAYSTSFPCLHMLPSYPSASPSHSEKRKKIQLGSQYCKLYRCAV